MYCYVTLINCMFMLYKYYMLILYFIRNLKHMIYWLHELSNVPYGVIYVPEFELYITFFNCMLCPEEVCMCVCL